MELLKGKLETTSLKNLKTAMHTSIREALPVYSKFLATKIVDIPLIVDKNTGVLLDGYEAFQALDMLSAEKAPVFRVDIEEVKIIALKPQLETITKETVLEAGLKGPKLPPKSFSVLAQPAKISYPLEKLLNTKEQSKKAFRVYDSTLELLAKNWPTPLTKLNSFSTYKRSVWAKLECFNPFSNSVKDRLGWFMIKEALENGELKKVLYEATSTNTGIALASVANILGLKAKLYLPTTIQKASDIYLEVLGAEVVRLPVTLTVEAISQVDSEAKADNAAHLNQFENDANFKVHLKYTAREIDEQLEMAGLKPSCIIGSLGTSGHMAAISFYFKNKYGDSVKTVAVQPAPNEVIPGIRRIETGMKWLHWTKFDAIIDVKQSEAIEGAIKTARKEGLLIGLSSGAVVHAFQKIAEEKGVYVLVFPDSGYKYAEQFENHFQGNNSKTKHEF